jgi:2-oxoglutarate ferredoxin oxidoreductase subunit beta
MPGQDWKTQAMTVAAKPVPTNHIGFERNAYEGGKSTLCIGCGHDLITRYIIDSLWQSGVEPHKVAKLSGIGCSSKTPAYFLSQSWGFNSVHGRMAAIATGANAANKYLLNVGVSGDGDTASIGMGQFVHMLRRNPQVMYIIENNGVYGLTKGQFSATADKGSKLKTGAVNDFHSIDLCSLSIELGCGFVARAFAGNKPQMIEILRAAASYPGTAVIDIISPCVTFNNFDFSKHGFSYMRTNELSVNDFGFVQSFENIEADIPRGTAKDVQFPDGSMIRFKTLKEDHDPTDRESAIRVLHAHHEKGEVLTGIFYVDPAKESFQDIANTVNKPLHQLTDAELRPSKAVLEAVMEQYT